MTPPIVFAVSGSLDTPTGGYGYDRRVITELRQAGHDVLILRLPDGFPAPDAEARREAEAQLANLPEGTPVIIDGLAFAVLDAELARLDGHLKIIALIHHPLAFETGISPAEAADFARSERAALGHAQKVIVNSPATAATLLADYGVSSDLVSIALPGTDRAKPSRGSGGVGPVRLVSVGSLTPRKGHLDLVAALASIKDRNWTLDILGHAGLHPPHAAALAQAINDLGLGDRVTLVGPVSRDVLEHTYDQADCFVLASHYEGYGMAYAEAIAHALPVIGTTGGAIPDTIGAGGVMVAPGDVAALAGVLAKAIADPEYRQQLRDMAALRAADLPTWSETAAVFTAAVGART